MQGHLLFVDDDPEMCELVAADLGSRGIRVSACSTPNVALAKLEQEDFDVVVTDLHMREMSGIDLCQRLAEGRSDLPVIVLTAFGSLEAAVAAIRAGAYDFVTKPVEMDELALHVERAIQHRALSEEVRRLRRAVERAERQGDLIGNSTSMREVYQLIQRVATTDVTVLISGESGTGKELAARAVHNASERSNGPFVALNCAAVPEQLLESELFGHAKGAFTDAKSARGGLLVHANDGTLFLDELSEMSTGMQAKLLRALQERTVRPVGETHEVSFNTRIIAATNRDLEAEVEEGRFREDLFYRINVVNIHMPPLRARGADILMLAQHFIDEFSARHRIRVRTVSKVAAEKLLHYDWPGNVRELQNCIERAVALAAFDELGVDDLPERVREFRPTRLSFETDDPAELLPMDEVERRYVLRVLEAVGGNKTVAAQVLGFDRKTLYRKLERYGEITKGAGGG